MDFKTRYPDYAAVETLIRRARAERSLYLAELIATAIAAVHGAVRSFLDRAPLKGSRIPWGPHDALPGKPVARQRTVQAG